jgi:hypothetical protein
MRRRPFIKNIIKTVLGLGILGKRISLFAGSSKPWIEADGPNSHIEMKSWTGINEQFVSPISRVALIQFARKENVKCFTATNICAVRPRVTYIFQKVRSWDTLLWMNS